MIFIAYKDVNLQRINVLSPNRTRGTVLCVQPSTVTELSYYAYTDPRQPGRLSDRYAAFQRFAQRCVPFVPLKVVKSAASVIPAVFVFSLSLQANPRFCNL